MSTTTTYPAGENASVFHHHWQATNVAVGGSRVFEMTLAANTPTSQRGSSRRKNRPPILDFPSRPSTVVGMTGFKKFDFRLEEFTRPALRAWLMVAFLVVTCNATGFIGGCFLGYSFGKSDGRNLERELFEPYVKKAYSEGRLSAVESMSEILNRHPPKINSPPQSNESERRVESFGPQK
jgi:hypothetical protein